jgi:hypothetical protein
VSLNSEVNKMGIENLAVVWAPNFIREPEDEPPENIMNDVGFTKQVVQVMMVNVEKLRELSKSLERKRALRFKEGPAAGDPALDAVSVAGVSEERPRLAFQKAARNKGDLRGGWQPQKGGLLSAGSAGSAGSGFTHGGSLPTRSRKNSIPGKGGSLPPGSLDDVFKAGGPRSRSKSPNKKRERSNSTRDLVQNRSGNKKESPSRSETARDLTGSTRHHSSSKKDRAPSRSVTEEFSGSHAAVLKAKNREVRKTASLDTDELHTRRSRSRSTSSGSTTSSPRSEESRRRSRRKSSSRRHSSRLDRAPTSDASGEPSPQALELETGSDDDITVGAELPSPVRVALSSPAVLRIGPEDLPAPPPIVDLGPLPEGNSSLEAAVEVPPPVEQ